MMAGPPNRRPGTRRQDAAAAFALAIVCAAALLFSMRGDRIPYPPGPDGIDAESAATSNRAALEAYTAHRFIVEARERGDALLWNPLEYGGTPFVASWTPRIYSPFTMPFSLVDLRWAAFLSAWMKITIASLLAFYGCRRLGVPRPFAVLIAAAYSLAGISFTEVMTPIADVWPWFPALFVAAERMATGYSRFWPFAGLAGGLILFSGARGAIFGCVLTCAAYGIALRRRGIARGTRGTLAVGCIAALAAAALLTAVQWLPYLTYAGWAGVPIEPGPYPVVNPNHPIAYLPAAAALLLTAVWITIRSKAPENYRRRVDTLAATSWIVWLIAQWVLLLITRARVDAQPWLGIDIAPNFLLLFSAGVIADAWSQIRAADDTRDTLLRGGIALLATLAPLWLIIALTSSYPFPRAPLTLGMAGTALAVLILVGGSRRSTALIAYGSAAVLAVAALALTEFERDWRPAREPVSWAASLNDAGVDKVAGTANLTRAPLAAHGIASPFGTLGRPSKGFRDYLIQHADRPEQIASDLGIEWYWLDRDGLHGVFAPIRGFLMLDRAMPGASALFRSARPPQPIRLLDEAGNSLDLQTSEMRTTNASLWVAVQSEEPGRLILPIAHHPGWEATRNGLPLPVGKYGPFIAVEIPPGAYEVALDYTERDLRRGALFSVIGALFVVAGLVHFAYRQWHV